MSLKKRIQQIAIESVKSYVGTLTDITQNNINSSSTGAVLAGKIQSYANGLYTVIFPDGSLLTVPPGGLRPIGPGDTVLISNGAIIG